MGNVMKFLIFLVLALFLWGWISNVALGKLNTGEYLYKIVKDFQQGVLNSVAELSRSQKAFMYNFRERSY